MASERRSINRRCRFAWMLVLVPVLLLSSSCARTAVFSDPELKTRTAVRVYSSTPYVLVARTGSAEKPTEVSIVHLPDLQNPQFIRFYSGLGYQKSSLAMTNGILTSLGFESDSKIPETIGAVAGLAKEVAAIAARSVEGGPSLAPREATFELYKLSLQAGRVVLVPVSIDRAAVGLGSR